MIDYLIAEALHLPLSQVRDLPSAEIEEWRSWLTYKSWEQREI